MKQWHRKITNKLFYGKYAYKISISLGGSYAFRYTKNKTDINDITYILNTFNNRFSKNEKNLINEFLPLAFPLLKDKNVLKYVSYNTITFYLNDKNLFDIAIKQLKKFILEIHEPSNEASEQYLLENNKKIITKKLPHGKYQFKIIFKRMPVSARESFYRWTQAYKNDELKVPDATAKFFKGASNTEYYSHYVYARDEGIKLLVMLAASGCIRRIEEYVLDSQINNEINQEQTCQL